MTEHDDMLQQRHKSQAALDRPRELIIACPPMRSNINLSRIARAAGCCGVQRMIACGTAKVIGKIARDSVASEEKPGRRSLHEKKAEADEPESDQSLRIDVHRTLPPVLVKLRAEGYQLVALEQTSDSECIYTFPFERKTALIIGNERLGVDEEVLRMVDRTIEIPVYGLPYSHNAASATIMAMYEYCRQFPRG